MKIIEYIAAQSICLAEHNRLTAWLNRAQTSIDPRLLARVRRADDDDSQDDPDSLGDDIMAAMYPPRPAMVVNEQAGFAIIPVSGMITRGLSVFEQRYFGCCDVDDLGEMIDVAAANDAIRTVVFNYNTPGGYLEGGPETAAKMAALTAHKDTIAYSDGMMCSMGYWFGAMQGRVVVSPSATIGSIGVYSTYVDMSKMADQMGLKVRVFASGKYKGMGEPGTSLTQEQADFIQSKIDRSATAFKDAVLAMRPGIPPEAMEGQWFDGNECVALGLADAMAPSLEDVLPGLENEV